MDYKCCFCFRHRECYQIPVAGHVSQHDLANFTTSLQKLWNGKMANTTVTALMKEEHVGQNG